MMEIKSPYPSRKAIIMAVTVMAILVTFAQFFRLNIMTSGNWALDIVRYQEAGRHQNWDELIAKDADPIVRETYGGMRRGLQDLGLFSFLNVGPYVLHSLLGVKGVALWLSQKLLLSAMGAGIVLILFFLTEMFYGPLVGFAAAVLIAFSPHFWIWFNVDSALLRSYNIFLSLAALTVFLHTVEARKTSAGWRILSIGLWALSFVFFHIGSFMMPLVALLYCVFYTGGQSRQEKGRVFQMFWISLAAGFCLALILQGCRLWWFHLPFSSSWEWFQGYWAKGPEASHSSSGIVLTQPHLLFANIKDHVMGLFVNGRTPADWHYGISPPGIASSYTPVITLFFLAGVFFAIREKRKGDILFLSWFFLFFLVYSFLIVVRQKNISLEVPAIFVLASRSLLSLVPGTVSFLKKFLLERWIDRVVIGRVLAILLLGPVIAQGAFFITVFLPQKAFYDNAAFSGTYQLYRHLAAQGYTRKTKIFFTMPQSTIGPIMMRLFSDGVMPVSCLTHQGMPYPVTPEAWRAFEEKVLPSSDKIVYCFMSFDNHAGNIQYVSDDPYRSALEQVHPDKKPFIILGLDKAPLWRVYHVAPPDPSGMVQTEGPGLAYGSSEEARNLAPESLSDHMIGSAFKTLAKAYVATLNMDKFRKGNLKVMEKMNDGKFEKKMRMVQPYIVHLPNSLRDKCGIKDGMTRKDAAAGLRQLTKPLMIEIIEAIPNAVIAGTFRKYQDDSKDAPKGSLAGQINEVWTKAMENSKIMESVPGDSKSPASPAVS